MKEKTVLDLTSIRDNYTLQNGIAAAASAIGVDSTTLEHVLSALCERGVQRIRLDRRPVDQNFLRLLVEHGLQVEYLAVRSESPPIL